MNAGLTPEQIESFEESGFLIVRDLLAPGTVQPLIDELEKKVDDSVNEAVAQGWLDAADTFPTPRSPPGCRSSRQPARRTNGYNIEPGLNGEQGR